LECIFEKYFYWKSRNSGEIWKSVGILEIGGGFGNPWGIRVSVGEFGNPWGFFEKPGL